MRGGKWGGGVFVLVPRLCVPTVKQCSPFCRTTTQRAWGVVWPTRAHIVSLNGPSRAPCVESNEERKGGCLERFTPFFPHPARPHRPSPRAPPELRSPSDTQQDLPCTRFHVGASRRRGDAWRAPVRGGALTALASIVMPPPLSSLSLCPLSPPLPPTHPRTHRARTSLPLPRRWTPCRVRQRRGEKQMTQTLSTPPPSLFRLPCSHTRSLLTSPTSSRRRAFFRARG